jgi:stage II sporulation protein P
MIMKKAINRVLIAGLLLLFLIPSPVSADDWFDADPGYYTILDENGRELTVMAREIMADDEYISGDNKHYIVTKVDKGKRYAYTRLLGEIELPVVEMQEDPIAAAQQGKGSVLLYCSHSDESYVPSDGTESIKGNGGVYDVAGAFQKSLEKKGVNVAYSKAKHDPHDAGAYRRSRQTAVTLIKKNMPVRAIFDIHRDAVPKSYYVTKVDGEDMSKVRIVLGRRNQNRKANEELAYKIKGVADKNYPGLVKDIFIAHGSYNQELSPRSLLFEFGTYENSKEAAEKSTAYLADVVVKTLYGGTVRQQSQKTGESQGKKTKVTPINQEKRRSGSGRGFLWLFIVLAVGALGFLFISKGSREMFGKNSTRQEFSSFLGRKKKK